VDQAAVSNSYPFAKMPELERVAKVTVYHYRKPGVSAEDFYRRMNEEFVPLALPIIQRHNILRFGLVCSTSI
jgi:hypothetical protein